MRSVVYAFIFLVISVSTSVADYNRSKDWFYDLEWPERIRVQHLLVFTGDYVAIVDGAFGKHTYNALTSFQKHRDFQQDGVLASNQMQVLERDGLDLVNRLGFEIRKDAAAGLSLGIPVKLFEPPSPTRRGSRWRAYDGSIELETLAVPHDETAYGDLFKRLSKSRQGRTIDYKKLRNDFFVVSGEQDGRDFYLRVMKTSGDSRGFSLAWESKHAVFMDRVAVAMSNSLDYYDGGTDAPLETVTSTPGLQPQSLEENGNLPAASGPDVTTQEPAELSTGSGYFVTAQGHIGTNAHVAGNCASLEVPGHGPARLVRADPVNDLAVIQLAGAHAESFARFRANQPIARGEQVFVLGYPFAQIFDSNLNFTLGTVSSLAGVKGDIRHFMISAPVQPGNSGGPVLDRTGALIGTVVSRLDKIKTLQLAGDFPENINFAIRGQLMSTFMESLGLAPSYNTITSIKTPTRIDEEAARYTVQILCRN
ncbi:serine protease [Roseibium marinum]|uniref:Trypsin-like peptidase n=1 Tax=Roseibium marinum TaxID=281252 RepID=A0A2S3ULI3_9HYPH|nr:serine protease [Roseibium marinum]POF28582.1 trypsin-like peptidase [Roseibium marinum]